jgi:hypothetical protein
MFNNTEALDLMMPLKGVLKLGDNAFDSLSAALARAASLSEVMRYAFTSTTFLFVGLHRAFAMKTVFQAILDESAPVPASESAGQPVQMIAVLPVDELEALRVSANIKHAYALMCASGFQVPRAILDLCRIF